MIYNAIIGLVNVLLVQGAKKIDSIPLSAGETAKIRTVVMILSFFGALFTDWLNGSIASGNSLQLMQDVVLNYIISHGIYAGIVRKVNPTDNTEEVH